MTFDELFAGHRLTPDERAELVWFLAMFRARRTTQVLLEEPLLPVPKWLVL